MTDLETAKVAVFVRCKPESEGRTCMNYNEEVVSVGEKTFNFDYVFNDTSEQYQIFEKCVEPLVKGCFQGFNATIFAYGQTGSGKTHSIMGRTSSEDDEGIIPRSIRYIFKTLNFNRATSDGNAQSTVRVSMIELYNEECKDLLHPDIPSKEIVIREDRDGKIFFTGAREETVTDTGTALYYVELGNLNRSTAQTNMNHTSSRSHAIFTISIELLEHLNVENEEFKTQTSHAKLIQAKLHIVDLAGSERAKRTGALGTRFKESIGINQGLLSLGKVIRALTSGSSGGPASHVPYRDSKLTRFLQDSLGGNSRTAMLACISTLEINLHETLNTLQYAARAKSVQNKVTANVSKAIGLLPPTAEDIAAEAESEMVSALKTQLKQMQRDMEILQETQVGKGNDELRDSLENSQKFGGTGGSVNNNNKLNASRMLRLMSEVYNALRVNLDHVLLVTDHEIDDKSCGHAVSLVNAAQKCVSLLKDFLYNSNGANGSSLRQSLSDSISNLRDATNMNSGANPTQSEIVDNLKQQLEAVQQELDECKEDLQRDEDIFAEKVRELKKVKRQLKEVDVENTKLREKQKDLQSKLSRFVKLPGTLRQTLGRSGFDGTDINLNIEEEDELDLSMIVAAAEPDISQLMEDIEMIAKEREHLQKEKQLLKLQQEDLSIRQQRMEAEIKSLEQEKKDLAAELRTSREIHHRKHEELQQMNSVELEKLKRENNSLNKVLESVRGKKQSFTEENQNLREKEKQLEQDLLNLKNEKEDFANQLHQAEEELDRQKLLYEEQQQIRKRENEENQQNIQRLQTQIQQQQDEQQSEQQKLLDELRVRVKEADDSALERFEENNLLRKELKEIQVKLDQNERTHDQVLKDIKKDFAEEKREFRNREDDLEEALSHLKQELNTARVDMERWRERRRVESDLEQEELEKIKNRLEEERLNREKEIQLLKTQLSKAQKQLILLQQQQKKRDEEDFKKIQVQLEEKEKVLRKEQEQQLRDLIPPDKEEVKNLRKEIERLSGLIRNKDDTSSGNIDQFNQQIGQLKKKLFEKQQQVKDLENKNYELRVRLDRANKGRRKSGEPLLQNQPVISDSMIQQTADRLLTRLEELVRTDVSIRRKAEMQKNTQMLENEKKELQGELNILIGQQKENEYGLNKKVQEIDKKIDNLNKKASTIKTRLKESKTSGSQVNELKQQYEDVMSQIESYSEHRNELTMRIAEGAIDDGRLSKIRELEDDLQALDTEIAHVTKKLQEAATERLKNLKHSNNSYIISKDSPYPDIDEESLNMEKLMEQEVISAISHLGGDFSTGDSEGSASKAGTGLLLRIMRHLWEVRRSSYSGGLSLQQLQQQLERKNKEYDHLLQSTQHARKETNKRHQQQLQHQQQLLLQQQRQQQQQQREAQDKVDFLLQQLRQTEARLSHSASRSFSRPSSAAQLDIP